jgi:hypothetical protein
MGSLLGMQFREEEEEQDTLQHTERRPWCFQARQMWRRTINSQTGNSQTEYGFIDVRYANMPKQKKEKVGVGEEEVSFEAKTVVVVVEEAVAEGKGARVLEKGGLTREQEQVGE